MPQVGHVSFFKNMISEGMSYKGTSPMNKGAIDFKSLKMLLFGIAPDPLSKAKYTFGFCNRSIVVLLNVVVYIHDIRTNL